ncbi:MAG: esterase-like activity of phytase family protein [Sphingomonadaceae bacterium]|uniref:esterase-like activity of phytase family protein n=1 Tax=Thermaurantiacus sp. TaxID=2820283 RepID=UPI00298F0C0B|nr:esterase-like activity of phytase family protein [Thermaurantiacus sp.]MCS6986073.1 esterase-like activity of phytase family protein [Sphingomonadaceae bacterium]MDW8414711.1 esterase-like activity of phytase family protein [Thermaurantiacus sp.]
MNRLALFISCLVAAAPAAAMVTYTGKWEVPGDATDLSGLSPAFAGNRLSFGSDLWYSRHRRTFFGNTDRGPGGGVISFQPRVHEFALQIQPDGSVAGFTLLGTTTFKTKAGAPFDGLNPLLLNGSKSVLGLSHDPEGLVRLKNGHFLVADEYGPSLYEFDRNGVFVRAFETPENLKPKRANGTLNYVDGRGASAGERPETGRQDNRGYEGLALSADGTFVLAILQDPLFEEGAPAGAREGRRSRNLRIVKFDVATGRAVGQYVYQLEPLADINARIPGTAQDFAPTAQGRNIGVSGILGLPNGKFLVLERDNRGFGVDPVLEGQLPVGSKRVYLIDLAGATDVSAISLAGTNDALPPGVVPVAKTLWLDVQAELERAGVKVAEKMEGIAFGPNLPGGRAFVVVTDNDFSVTQTGGGTQFDVCTDGISAVQVTLGAPCPAGLSLIPSYAYVFKASGPSLWAAGIPEASTWTLMIAGFGLVGSALRRRQRMSA